MKQVNWWDKQGEPQYGGELIIASQSDIENFDPYYSEHRTQIYTGWLEKLASEDWTLDPAVFGFKIVAPHRYLKGLLAESGGGTYQPASQAWARFIATFAST